MKIAVAQIRVYANNPERNFATIEKYVNEYKDKCDLIVFPEMCVGGYFVSDKYFNGDFINVLLEYNQRIKQLSHDVGIVWGNVYKEGNRLYNTAFFAYKNDWVDKGRYYKQLLPSYGVFDDNRYFVSGKENRIFTFNGQKIALQVCEDLWDSNYENNVTSKLIEMNPDIIINISCSPWTNYKQDQRTEEIKKKDFNVPFVYVNSVGMQNIGKNVLLLDGNSQVLVDDKTYYLNNSFEEEVKVIDFNDFKHNEASPKSEVYKALQTALKCFDEEVFESRMKWIVGVSGGLDSSVSLAVLATTLPKDRVIGVTMPSKHTSSTTLNNAKHLCDMLGVELRTVAIGDLVDATVNSLKKADYDEISGFDLENVQARIRGHVLMSVASIEGGVVINNGNKVEIAFGYATMYGDMIGALSLLADLTKIEVGEVAQDINETYQKEIVPYNLIPIIEESNVTWDFKPSAELRDNQVDPMKWGYHDLLIQYLMKHNSESLIKKHQDGSIYDLKLSDYLKQYGLDDFKTFVDDLKWVEGNIKRAVYKRIQAPPIVVCSDCSFGLDYKESQF